jgi:FkbM family methyltransferase
MKRFFFLLKAFPAKFRLKILFLLAVERVISPTLRYRVFANFLIESRSIVGYIFTNHGKVVPYSDGMDVTWMMNGREYSMLLRWHSSDFLAFEQVIIREEYLPIVEKLSQSGAECSVIVDAGANIGCSSIYFASFFKQATIVAIEPDPQNFIQLNTNVRRNLSAKYVLLEKALWHKAGQFRMNNKFKDGRNWSMSIDHEVGATEATTLSAITTDLRIQTIDLLKVDIEGAEKELIANDAFLHQLKQTRFLAMEVHEAEDVETFTTNLRSIHYEVFSRKETLFGVNKAR